MRISEFVACDADYDAALRFAGSLPDGTDVEHTPVACWPDVVNRRIAALEGEVAELRASVPWDAIDIVHLAAISSLPHYLHESQIVIAGACATVKQWRDRHPSRKPEARP